MTTPTLKISEIRLYERPVTLRLPFRFGVVTLTQAREALVRVRIRLSSGEEAWGCAAELLAPKWFDKNTALSNDQNMEQLRVSLRSACGLYEASGSTTAFGLFAQNYETQIAACVSQDLNSLIACFGPAMLDRAVLDALCHATGTSFYQAIQRNLVGLEETPFAQVAADFAFEPFLAALKPSRSIHARHTVGLVDPITGADQSAGERVNNGLPETLEEVIEAYGHTRFKVKVSGDLPADLSRLTAIAAVLDRLAGDYKVSLDGNEQYDSVEEVMALWEGMATTPALAKFMAAILFIEQPIKRHVALSADMGPLAAHRPVIIDESDADFDAFPNARALGYSGVSSKTCKGVYRSIINLARCQAWNGSGSSTYFLSAEDLTTQPGVSVQQDLALVSLLGLSHVERNGHHYVRGMTGCSAREQAGFLAAHPDLYRQLDDTVALRIKDGQIQIGSLSCTGFAIGAEPDWPSLQEMCD
ncbi:MAG: enolase C-terminal domain-like protein [Alphaproteobacteria bacterium]